jgi:ankyrin repeat protein
MFASKKGDLQLVQWLLDKDVNVNIKDKQQRNCLFYAISSNADNADVVSALLAKGYF